MTDKTPVLPPDEGEDYEVESDKDTSKSLVVAKDLLPDDLMIIPLHDRPMFPKMMGPIFIDDPVMRQTVMKHVDKNTPLYFGLILLKPSEDGLAHSPQSGDDFFNVGVAVRVVQVSPYKPNEPLQIIAQALDRFDVIALLRKDSVYMGEVKYWQEKIVENSEEFKAYSVAIIDCIKELVNLNPLFKEGLSLLIERINVSDPGSLADFAASMTTSSGAEIQRILEIRDVRTRIEAVLVLLKKEVEISKLKAKISKRIEEQLSKQQREFFLKQQLQEIH